MKKTIRFFSLALAILMLVPMLSVFPVRVTATETSYDAAQDGDLLRTVDFNSDEWKQSFYNNYNNANVDVSDDGRSVSLTVLDGDYRYAWWGGYYPDAEEGTSQYNAYQTALYQALPMKTGAKYTVVFDLTLGSDNVGFGVQVDGENAFVIRGDGYSAWYGGNDVRTNKGTAGEKWSAHIADGTNTRNTQTFALTLDYDAKTMSLYVKDINDGAFYFCRSICGSNFANVWDASVFRCRFYVRSLGETPDLSCTADISDLTVYKGNVLNTLSDGAYLPSYRTHKDGDELLKVNFSADEWKQSFYNNYTNANVVVSDDGTAVGLTVQNGTYKFAWWGGYYPDAAEDTSQYNAYQDALAATLPMNDGVQYTMIFDLTLGSDNVGFGIQVDGENAFVIRGDGYSAWYGGNDVRTNNGTAGEKWSAHIADGTTKRDTQTFALTLDYDTKTMSLYVKDINDGSFYFCRSICGSNFINVWDASVFRCRFYVRSFGGTPNANYSADISDLTVYKGNILNSMSGGAYLLPYQTHTDGDELLKVNFSADEWKQSFYNNYTNANVAVSDDGTAVGLTVQNGTYKFAWWGGYYPDAAEGTSQYNAYQNALYQALPMKAGAKYTVVFDLTLGSDNVGFGIQVDGENAFVIRGDGYSAWYGGNCPHTNNGTSGEKWSAHIADGTTKRDTHTFALTVDYDRKMMSLYVKDINDGAFYFCRSICGSNFVNVWDASAFRCSFYIKSLGGTPNASYTAQVKNMRIYKGAAISTSNISILSYNIEYLDGNHDGGVRSPEKAMQTILSESPDIFGLQEVDAHWDEDEDGSPNEDDLIFSLTSNGYTRIKGDTTSETWPEILYKTTRFNKLNSGYKRYSLLYLLYPNVPTNGADPSRDTKSRLFTWALLQDKYSGKTTLVISTHLHLHANANDPGNSEANALVRNHEIRLMLAWLNTQTFVYDALVVLGDMNTDYTGELGKTTISIFKNEGGFAVTRDSAQTKGDIGGTLVDDNAPGTRNLRREFIYDYILTKGNVETTYYTVVDNKIDNGGTSYPSDHLPILSKCTVY